MPNKEFFEEVAGEIAKSRGCDPEECVFGSSSTIQGFTRHQRHWSEKLLQPKPPSPPSAPLLQEADQLMLGAASTYSANTFTGCGAGYWRAKRRPSS